jgi:hypothetical protein
VEHALSLAEASARLPERDDPAAVMRLVFTSVRDQLAATALAEANDLGDYAATLAVVAMTSDVICVGQIGDTIAVLGHGGGYEVAAPAPRPEYVNETSFVTDDDAPARVRITVRPSTAVDSVFLSTDGLRFKILSDLAAGTPFTPFFEDLHAYLRSPGATGTAIRQFLTGVDDQSGDDKTLVAAVRDNDWGERPRCSRHSTAA